MRGDQALRYLEAQQQAIDAFVQQLDEVQVYHLNNPGESPRKTQQVTDLPVGASASRIAALCWKTLT